MATSTNATTSSVVSTTSGSDTFSGSSTAPMTSTDSSPSISSSPSAVSSSSVVDSSTMSNSTTDDPPVSSSSSSSVSSSSSDPTPPPSSSSSSVSSATPPPSSASSSSSSTPPPSSSSSSSSSSSQPPPPPSSSSSSRPVSSSSSQPPPSSTPDPPASSSDPPPNPPSSSSASPTPPQVIISTFSTRVVITTTDSRGFTSTTAPLVITETSTSTQQDGHLVTVTQIYSNPTLSPDNNNSKGNSFFSNTGAVAGVFVLVGLAAAAIILYLFFAVRRRRRTLRLEHDTAVSATLAAAGFHRTPLDDDDDPAAGARHTRLYSGVGSSVDDPFQARAMLQRRSSSGLAMSSVPSASAGRASAAYLDDNAEFNPYASGDYIVPAGAREGYVSGTNYLGNGQQGATTQATQGAALVGGMRRDRSNSSGLAEMGAHSHNYSNSGSFEPLLASYYRRSMGNGNPPSPVLPLASIGAGAAPAGVTEGDGGDAPLPPDSNTVRFPPAYSSSHGHEQPPADVNEPLVQIAGDENADAASSVYSNDSVLVDDRLDPGLRLRQRLQRDTSTRDLRDEEDYSRPVLGVRNLPDGASQMSA